MPQIIPIEPRLARNIVVDPGSGCWLWTGTMNPDGYGHISLEGRTASVHRVVYEMYRQEIPPGLVIDHLCRRRNCANPDHMEPVPPAENTRRGAPATKSHCKNGHPLDEANTYRRPNGRRTCRACNRAAVAALKLRRTERTA